MKRYDVLVIGSGPAGQQAALTAARAGARVAVVERDRKPGGACLHRGTIPSKTLREAAQRLQRLQRDGARFGITLTEHLRVDMLTEHLSGVINTQVETIDGQFEEHGVERLHGAARFVTGNVVEIQPPGGKLISAGADTVVVAAGSRPRRPPGIEIDHEYVVDSDSILSLEYLPSSLTVLGGGVIACEYASIFAALGVQVTIVDGGARPLAFLDEDLSHAFRCAFEDVGGRYVGGAKATAVKPDGLCSVRTLIDGSPPIDAERVMVALGRVPNTERLGLDTAGVELNCRGYVVVDEDCRTSCPTIYAVGDLIGAPALASSAMEQGRRAVQHALGLPAAHGWQAIPAGIYTVPEIASIGLTEAQARERHGNVRVGRAEFETLARGQISGERFGMLKLISDPNGVAILGVGVVGEGAAELVGLGQMAMLLGGRVSDFVDNIFNFPTMAEAYRVAALQILDPVRAEGRAA